MVVASSDPFHSRWKISKGMKHIFVKLFIRMKYWRFVFLDQGQDAMYVSNRPAILTTIVTIKFYPRMI